MSCLQARLVRGLEARYARCVGELASQGVSPGEAHRIALEEIKGFGRAALEELRRRGLSPWTEAERVEYSTASVENLTGNHGHA
jgi:hypothetical protein